MRILNFGDSSQERENITTDKGGKKITCQRSSRETNQASHWNKERELRAVTTGQLPWEDEEEWENMVPNVRDNHDAEEEASVPTPGKFRGGLAVKPTH